MQSSLCQHTKLRDYRALLPFKIWCFECQICGSKIIHVLNLFHMCRGAIACGAPSNPRLYIITNILYYTALKETLIWSGRCAHSVFMQQSPSDRQLSASFRTAGHKHHASMLTSRFNFNCFSSPACSSEPPLTTHVWQRLLCSCQMKCTPH